MAAVPGEGQGRAFGGSVEVGVVEDDVGGFTAQFQGQRQYAVGGDVPQFLAGANAAGEGDFTDVRVVRHGRADHAALADDHVEHARRNPGLDCHARQFHQRRRGVLGRLGHHGVAGGQGRSNGAGGLMQRGVPRQDHADHPERIAAGVDVVVRALVDHFAVHDIDDAAVELEVLRGQVHQLRHFPARLAGFGTLKGAEGAFAGADQSPEIVEDAPTLGRAHVAPGLQRSGGGVDGDGHVGGAAVGHFVEFFAGARVDLVDVFTVQRRGNAPADEAVGSIKHCRFSSQSSFYRSSRIDARHGDGRGQPHDCLPLPLLTAHPSTEF
ncbi:hypothetical protein D3C87_1131470 [compost metagenome]